MKILMITESLCKGGKERRIIELLRYFDSHYSLEIKLVLLKDLIDYPDIIKLKNTELYILHRRIKKDPRIIGQLYSICKDFNPEIIHSWGSMPSIYSFGIAKILKIAFVNGMITNAYCKVLSSHWIRAKITFPFSDIIMANSYAGLAAFKVKGKKGRVVYNGFNPDRLKTITEPATIRKRYGIVTDNIVGMIGAFHPRKDYLSYLAAAKQVSSHRSDTTFLAVGDGKELESYKGIYQDCPFIKFAGNVADVESIINTFTIGILLTNPRVHQEGISNALMEIMAFEKPVIATQGGGSVELIENWVNGVLISENSIQKVTNSIEYLLDNKSIAEKMGVNSKNRIQKTFSIKNMSEEIFNLYNSIKK